MELEKRQKFDEKNLNIKLTKFIGYASSTDIFTFQSDFEKVHLRTTPKEPLPDLLKNNFLEDPALKMVKPLDEFDEIWDRLKSAYGNPRLMMSRMIAEISAIDGQFRSREPEKVSTGLSKNINIMKDLEKLSKKHKIEQKLYNGEGVQRISKVIGEGRITRWLSQNADTDMDEEEAWRSILVFLEKEIKVVQRRQIFLGKADLSQDKGYSRDFKHDGSRIKGTHYPVDGLADNDAGLLCPFCGESGPCSNHGPFLIQSDPIFCLQAFCGNVSWTKILRVEEKRIMLSMLISWGFINRW